ncbi:RNA polymerase sigma factor [Pseudogemmobacter sonorensis]|uniref:RNA polymerase sigma factor n=1 Tax=Pseudogemmobacter sonorensis TaxID=2989681 RepID=UPI003698DBF3
MVARIAHIDPDFSVTWDIQALFSGHARRVARSLTRRGLAADVAEDLTQDVFLRILEKSRQQTMPQSGEDPSPLLFRIARNLMIDQWRRESARPQVPLMPGDLDMIADPAPLTEQRIYDRQRLELTAKALAEMPERTRRAFELHRIEGRTIAEVSTELGVSTSRGWALVHDAYRRIRQILHEG